MVVEGAFCHGSQALSPKILAGKHATYLLLRLVLNAPDRAVLKTGFKSWFGYARLPNSAREVELSAKNR